MLVVQGLQSGCLPEDQATEEEFAMQKPTTPSVPSMPSVSRPAPPMVRFVVFEGIKYRQVLDATPFGKDQRTGYLAAYPENDDEPVWLLKVYTTTRVEHLEQDVQDVFFTKMELDADKRQLLIENESGNSFVVDIDSKSVK
jgi:hypothetical protein